jgi:hypothetical protein
MVNLVQNRFQTLIKGRGGVLVAALFLAGFVGYFLVSASSAASTKYSEVPLLDGNRRTYGALTTDIDGDGDRDILLNNHGYEKSGLYLNDGTGHLTDHGAVFQQYPNTTLQNDRHDCDVADVDLNGKLDIYCAAGADWGTETKVFPNRTNELLMQQADGTFINKSDVYGVMDIYARGRDVVFVNANGDNYPDLITTADPRDDGKKSQTIVYINNGGAQFTDTGSAGIQKNGPVRCLEKADWNNDGFDDIAFCPFNAGVKLFESNRNGTYKDVTTLRGAGPTTTQTWGVEFVDLNKDGFEDMVRTNTTNFNVRLWNNSTKKFMDGGQTVKQTDSKDLAIGYFNADDKPDLYVLNKGCDTCTPATNKTDKIYLGDGTGKFTFYADVNAPGTGDFVTSWDYKNTGRAGWIVGNGKNSASGPLQIIMPNDMVISSPVVVFADTTPPSSSLLNYKTQTGGTVSGTTVVTPVVTDDRGVQKVVFYLGSEVVFTDTQAPFEWSWDTTTALNQSYQVQAVAYDAAGNVSSLAENPDQQIDVVVQNGAGSGTVDTVAPTSSLNSFIASQGSVFRGTVTVAPEVSDNIGVAKVTFYLGFAPVHTDTEAPFEWMWNTTTIANKAYKLQARAFDAAGNQSLPANNPGQIVDITVSN